MSSGSESAAAAAAVATAGTDSAALREYFAAQESRTLEPWRATLEIRKREWEAFGRKTQAELINEMVDQAKARALTSSDVLQLMYLFFTNADAQRSYAACVLRRRGHSRIRVHNWLVAREIGEDFLAEFGPRLDDLPFPLFPPDPRFSTLNTRLLNEAAQVVGAGSRALPSVFLWDDVASTVRGAGALPVTQIEGQWGVDTSPIEVAFTHLQARVEGLEKQAQRQQRQAQPQTQHQQPQQHQRTYQQQSYQQPQQSYQQPQQQYQQQRSRGRRGGAQGGATYADATFMHQPMLTPPFAPQPSAQPFAPQPFEPQPFAPQPSQQPSQLRRQGDGPDAVRRF
ncbi:MAG: hypothetical protein Q8R01_00765 [Ramlibacter sp.]|nr:hypothetical protein [Ramlibacter sp.]